MAETSLVDQLGSLKNELEYAKQQDKLSPEGLRLLNLIDEGTWADDGLAPFLQVASLNFSDEIMGTIKGVFSTDTRDLLDNLQKYNLLSDNPVTTADLGTAVERLESKEYAEANPVKSMAYEAGGAITTGLIPGFGASRTIGGAIGTGAAFGFGAGVGAAEGDITDRLGEGALSGVLSAGIGAGLELGARGLSRVYDPVVAMFQSNKMVGKDLARQLIKEAIQNDAGTVEEGLKIVLEKATGKPYTMADLGTNSEALLDAVALLPGIGREQATRFLKDREVGSLKRLSTDLSEAFGDGASFFDEYLALQTSRAEKAGELYRSAYKKKIPTGAKLSNLLGRNAFRDAEKTARDLFSNKGMQIPNMQISEKGDILITPKGASSPVGVDAIDTEYLDFLKRGIDKQIFLRKKSDGTPLSSEEVQTLVQLKNEFTDYIDKFNPDYKKARDFWSDETSILNAMDRGRNFESEANRAFNEFRRDIASMTEGEKTALRLGMMQKMLQKIGGQAGGEEAVIPAAASSARNILKNSDNLSIMRATFPGTAQGQAKFDKFVSNLKAEVDMRSTAMAVLGNSKTASRQEIVKRINGAIEKNAESPDGLFNFVQRTLKRDLRGVEEKQRQALGAELSRILTNSLKDETGSVDNKKVKQLMRQLMGQDVLTIMRTRAPELLPALGRSAIAPTVPATVTSGVAADTPFGQSVSRFVEGSPRMIEEAAGMLTQRRGTPTEMLR